MESRDPLVNKCLNSLVVIRLRLREPGNGVTLLVDTRNERLNPLGWENNLTFEGSINKVNNSCSRIVSVGLEIYFVNYLINEEVGLWSEVDGQG